METIIVAVDFSHTTDLLLAAAGRIARKEDKIYLVHVAAPEPDFVGYGVGPQYIRDDRALQLQEEHKLLSDYKKQLVENGFKAEALLVAGPTVETLLNEIEKLKGTLLIIGRKGHSTLYEVLIGSVCKDIISKLRIPALLIPEVGEE